MGLTFENLQKSFKEFDILKGGKKTGIYENTSENRRLGRVGQKYSKDDEGIADSKIESSLDIYKKELDSIINKPRDENGKRKFSMKEAERRTYLQSKIKELEKQDYLGKQGNYKD